MSQTFEGKRGKEGGRNPYARHFGCLRKSCPFLLYLRAGETEWEWPYFAVRNQFRNQFGGKIKKGNSRKYFKGRWGELLSFLCMCVWSFSSHFSQMKQKKSGPFVTKDSWWLTQEGVPQQLIILYLFLYNCTKSSYLRLILCVFKQVEVILLTNEMLNQYGRFE